MIKQQSFQEPGQLFMPSCRSQVTKNIQYGKLNQSFSPKINDYTIYKSTFPQN